MKQRSIKERFFVEVGEAMSMNEMRCYINLETLEVEIHASEDFFSEEDEDTAQEAMDNPEKFLVLGQIYSSQSFKIMEEFAETVKDQNLQRKLFQALERRKPFANFKNIIDESSVRDDWFEFRDESYAEIAKDWLEDNASDELKEKIKALPSVFIAK